MDAVARGFLSGIAAGAVVAAVGAVGLSFIIAPPEPPKPDAVPLGVPVGSEFNQSRKDEEAELPAGEPGPQMSGVPQVEAPAPDDLASLETSDTRPTVAPQTGQPRAGLTTPGESGASGLSIESDTPVAQAGAGDAPAAPAQEPAMSISTDPAQPRPPEAATEETAFASTEDPEAPAPSVLSEAPVEPALPDSTGEITTDLQGVETKPEKPSAMAAPAAGNMPQSEESEELVIRVDPAPARPRESITTAEPEPRPDEEPPSTAEPEAEEDRDDRVETTPGAPGSEREEAETQDSVARPDTSEPGEQGAAPAVTIGKPATRLTEQGDRVTTENRPMIGTAALPPTSPETRQPETAAPTSEPPFVRYSEPFEAPENKPKMAIVLIDDPSASVGIEALSTFPYTLSFAVDTSRPGAADRMAIYRAAGFEVLALVDLPEGAGAGDVEVAMQVLLDRVPEAVGVMEAPGDGIQSSREIVTQVTEIVGNSGHGLLLYPKGLDTGRKLASKAGVPAASIFRDFDAKDEKPSVIRRFLNYAALKAGGEGDGVVMVGRLRPDTVTALLLWGLEDRARDVALTPVSAIMQAAD